MVRFIRFEVLLLIIVKYAGDELKKMHVCTFQYILSKNRLSGSQINKNELSFRN